MRAPDRAVSPALPSLTAGRLAFLSAGPAGLVLGHEAGSHVLLSEHEVRYRPAHAASDAGPQLAYRWAEVTGIGIGAPEAAYPVPAPVTGALNAALAVLGLAWPALPRPSP